MTQQTDVRTDEKKGHYYVQTFASWSTGERLLDTIKRAQSLAGSLKPKEAKIFFVPLPNDASYKHDCDTGPHVVGTVYMGIFTL
jgi:hypothetical protein